MNEQILMKIEPIILEKFSKLLIFKRTLNKQKQNKKDNGIKKGDFSFLNGIFFFLLHIYL